jgi:hypothetical protein
MTILITFLIGGTLGWWLGWRAGWNACVYWMRDKTIAGAHAKAEQDRV